MVWKIFFSSEPPEKLWRTRRKWRKLTNSKRFAFQANSININEFKCWPFMQTIKLYLYDQKYSSKRKLKIIMLLIQSLGLVLLLLEILAIILLVIIWKSMQIEQFTELLTEHWYNEVMSNGKFYIKAYSTLKLTF